MVAERDYRDDCCNCGKAEQQRQDIETGRNRRRRRRCGFRHWRWSSRFRNWKDASARRTGDGRLARSYRSARRARADCACGSGRTQSAESDQWIDLGLHYRSGGACRLSPQQSSRNDGCEIERRSLEPHVQLRRLEFDVSDNGNWREVSIRSKGSAVPLWRHFGVIADPAA
jgi:hypothetical protein